MPRFIFNHTPQILHHFNFISNLVLFHLITEFELDLFDISSREARLGPTFLLIYSLASIHFGSASSK